MVPASAGYTAVQMTTPVVPAGATHLSIGISLRAVGQVTGDDFHLSDADQDRGGPTTAMTAPATGALVSGQVDLAATASDDIGVAKVEFLVDDQVVGTDTGAPYTTTIDSTTLADGPHTVRSRATDTSNNVALGDPITITVHNGAPTVALLTPAAGALVHGSAALAAVATDSGGVDHVPSPSTTRSPPPTPPAPTRRTSTRPRWPTARTPSAPARLTAPATSRSAIR